MINRSSGVTGKRFMAMKVSFWFEFASTYSYPAAMRIESLAERYGVAIKWRPFLLGPIFRKYGWEDSPFNLYPEKGNYMWRDLERLCAKEGIPFHQPSEFPRNGLLAARIACFFADEVWLPEFVRAVYQANFEHDLDIADAAVVKALLPGTCKDPENVVTRANTPESKLKLREQTVLAEERGIFGAPSMLVGNELFWGNDRLDDAFQWAARLTE